MKTLPILLGFAIFIYSVNSAKSEDFSIWLEKFHTEARQFGITDPVFTAAFKGVKPDLRLPDLVGPDDTPKTSPGPKHPSSRGQAEFTRPPQDYVREKTIARLADQGRALARQHAATLKKIEQRFNVPAAVVLAIWGRETAYGAYRPEHDAIVALTTQAYAGRRKDLFRKELLYALKMLQDGVVSRQAFRTSWAGAFGLTQFMPSEYDKLAVDLENDGRRDVWSFADALASAANQLKAKGWVPGISWGYEVVPGDKVTCAQDGPQNAVPVAQWLERGVRRVANRQFAKDALTHNAFLFSPGGGMGPQFLATENFLVLKRYNMSDLYALFVGHLADRISGGGPFAHGWGSIRQLPNSQIAAIQEILKHDGYAIEKIDGRIGPNTRSQIGRYQVAHKWPVTCWPSADLLARMRRP